MIKAHSENIGAIKIGMTREFIDTGAQIWNKDVFARISALPNVNVSPVHSDETGITDQDLAEFDILVVRKTGVPESAFSNPDSIRTRLIARFGVNYDHIAMDACTRNLNAVTISPEGVRRPVAGSIVTLVMALSHRLREKDLLIRRGDWADGLALA